MQRHEVLQAIISSEVGAGCPKHIGQKLDAVLSMMETQNQRALVATVYETMLSILKDAFMLKDFMAARKLEMALADTIRDDATEMYINDAEFKASVDSQAIGIMRLIESHTAPITKNTIAVFAPPGTPMPSDMELHFNSLGYTLLKTADTRPRTVYVFIPKVEAQEVTDAEAS